MFGDLKGTSQEHRVGAAIFRQARYVFQLKKMMRFKDERLVNILNTMRTVGGKPLSDSDWKALLATELGGDTPSTDVSGVWLVPHELCLERHFYGYFRGGKGICEESSENSRVHSSSRQSSEHNHKSTH